VGSEGTLCAAAAIGDAIANTMITGVEVIFHRITIAAGVRNEVLTLASDGIGYVGSKFWESLADYAEREGLLGSTEEDIARNRKLLTSPGTEWSAAQTAIYLYLQKKEGVCPRTN
jgi:hypothetical protein